MKVSLIIAAAGAGTRFCNGGATHTSPLQTKLFIPIHGKPLLTRTLESFQGLPQIREILIAVPEGNQSRIHREVLKGYEGPRVRLLAGGATRAESVWKALRRTSAQNKWVMVHDGARPFPPREAVARLLEKSPRGEGKLLARAVVPTLKRALPGNGRVLETVDRTNLFEAETPQLIRRDILLKAYRENPRAFEATDESSLVESMGGRIEVVSHSGWNVKVTTPEDLKWAEAYWAKGGADKPAPTHVTVGWGTDLHRLVKGRKLFLGGVRIPFAKGALGHSDGDVLLHALADALLGALARGDLGEWFSDKDPHFKGIPSKMMLEKIFKDVQKEGWQLERVDSVIHLERPKLTPYKEKIRTSVARLFGMDPEKISVKAKTMEGLGPIGEGLALSAEALVLLAR